MHTPSILLVLAMFQVLTFFVLFVARVQVATPDASGTATQQDETVATLDLLLRWISLRFFDTNTSVLLKALEYLACVFRMLSQLNHHLSEYEASAFIPYLVQKVCISDQCSVKRFVLQINVV